MSIRLWIAFEDREDGRSPAKSLIMVLNLTSLQNEMKNNTMSKVTLKEAPKSSTSCRPVMPDCKKLLEATHEWSTWASLRHRSCSAFAQIDNTLVSISYHESCWAKMSLDDEVTFDHPI
jgi:hypothetical protein